MAYCPSFLLGENYQSLEKMSVELLSDIKKCNNREKFRAKREKTFVLRRQEIIHDAPMTNDVQERGPALFDVMELSRKKSFNNGVTSCAVDGICNC